MLNIDSKNPLIIGLTATIFLSTGCSSTAAFSIKVADNTQNNSTNLTKVTRTDAVNLPSYKVDPHHANVRFAINHMNTSTVTGGFYELTGDVKFSPEQKQGYIDITIDMSSVHSVSKVFIEKLKSDKFFNIAKYPTAQFKSTKWHFDNTAGKNSKVRAVDGILTMHGKSNPVTLTADSFNCYFHPMFQKTVCGGDFSTVIDRTKWGVDKYVKMGVPKDVKIDIEIEAVKQ